MVRRVKKKGNRKYFLTTPQAVHRFHLVDGSFWPFSLSMQLFSFTTLVAAILHSYIINNTYLFFFTFIGIVVTMSLWFENVLYEGTYTSYHTFIVQTGLRLGFILFITSEVMFFMSFFWGYLHTALAPTEDLGSVWPPYNQPLLDAYQTPLYNTVLLLTSGAAITLAHLQLLRFSSAKEIRLLAKPHTLFLYKWVDICRFTPVLHIVRSVERALLTIWVGITIILACIFTYNQFLEYIHAPFGITHGVYGSLFFMLTGFHGFHVIIGTIFLSVVCVRAYNKHYLKNDHFSFEAAAWYWHFVDVVWLYLYALIYIKF